MSEQPVVDLKPKHNTITQGEDNASEKRDHVGNNEYENSPRGSAAASKTL